MPPLRIWKRSKCPVRSLSLSKSPLVRVKREEKAKNRQKAKEKTDLKGKEKRALKKSQRKRRLLRQKKRSLKGKKLLKVKVLMLKARERLHQKEKCQSQSPLKKFQSQRRERSICTILSRSQIT